MKLALYDRGDGSQLVVQWNDRTDIIFSDYVRLSDPVEVEFPMLSDDVVIAKQLDAIDKLEQAARNELQRKLDEFNDRRASLRALTVQS